MTTNPIRRRAKRRNELQKQKSRKGVETRRRMMRERAAAWHDVGGLTTDGVLGAHSVRLLVSETYGDRLAVVVDDLHRQARTLRGVVRCMAQMIFKASGGG